MNPHFRSLLGSVLAPLERSRLGRLILLVAGRLFARAVTQRPIDFQYINGCWFRIDDGAAIPLGSRFQLSRGALLTWESRGDEVSRLRRAWWFRYYRPSAADFVVDVGAGRGEDVFVFYQAVGCTGHIVAVEAHPATAAILRNFVLRNQLANVEVHQLAAAQKTGTRLISATSEDQWQCASILCDVGEPTPAIRLDDLPSLRAAKKVDFLKMNIEGAEEEALNGATSILRKTNSVCICCHDFLGEETRTKSAVCALLEGAGFRLRFSPPDAPPYEQDFVYGER